MTSFKNKIILSFTLFLTGLPIAHAARPGWYLGLQGGYANTHMQVEDLVTIKKDNKPFQPQAYLPHFVASARSSIGYLFKSDLAIEMGWQTLQRAVLDEYVTSDHYSLNGCVEGFAWDVVAKKSFLFNLI